MWDVFLPSTPLVDPALKCAFVGSLWWVMSSFSLARPGTLCATICNGDGRGYWQKPQVQGLLRFGLLFRNWTFLQKSNSILHTDLWCQLGSYPAPLVPAPQRWRGRVEFGGDKEPFPWCLWMLQWCSGVLGKGREGEKAQFLTQFLALQIQPELEWKERLAVSHVVFPVGVCRGCGNKVPQTACFNKGDV